MVQFIFISDIKYKGIIKYIFSGLFVLCLLSANAEELMKPEYAYRRFTTADGLQAMRNECIRQDKNGYIWVAGVHGLTRYDGFEFKPYLKGKFSNLCRLDKDSAGHIRAFTNNLMYTINEKNDSIVRKEIIPRGSDIEHVSSKNLPDGYGIYSCSTDMSLYAINDTGLVKILEHEYLDIFPIVTKTTFYDVEKKHLYLPFKDTVKVIANNTEISIYPNINANSFCYHNGAVIALAANGIYKLENGKAKCLFNHEIDIISAPTKIYADDNGSFFFCAYQHLLRVKNNRIDTLFTTSYVKDFIVDSDENIWVLTVQGLYNLFRLDFRNYVLTDKNDVVRNVSYNPGNNAVIAATLEGKVYEITDSGIRHVNYPPNPDNPAFFNDYGCYSGDAIYLPGPNVLMFKGDEMRWLELPAHIYYGFVANLQDGYLIAGGAGRMLVLTPEGKLVKEFGKTAVKQNIYAKPCVDKYGRLWLGGFDGVTIYDIATDSTLSTMFSDSLKIVKFMENDCEGNVWFASENRLFVADKNMVRQEHIFDYEIQGIFFTRNNTLIVSTLGGICIFDSKRKNYTFYNHENGFTGMEPSSGSMVEDAAGNIWLPSLTGLFCFNPEQLKRSQYKPKLQLLSMTTSGDNVRWEKAETMDLNYRQDNVRFAYIGLSYLSAQNVRYRYRLTGFQNEFSKPVKLREVTFNSLSPGDYVFEIFADMGIEGSQGETLSVSFTIHPAFWQTTLFWVICAALLMLSGAGIMMYIQRRRNKARLERLEIEKRLNDLKISSIRLKAIPHFNANVMAAIEYYIMNKSKEDTMRILGIYSRFTFETLQDVDKASRSLTEELNYVKMYLELEKTRFIDKFDYVLKVDENIEADKVQLPNMILHTWAENAVKHGLSSITSGGRLTISANQSENIVYVSVEDNGIGRKAAINNPRIRSTKQGLNILSQQIEIYNRFNKQKIKQTVKDLFTDGKASGTIFSLEIPASYNYKI